MILKYFKGIVRSEYIYISTLNNRIFFLCHSLDDPSILFDRMEKEG